MRVLYFDCDDIWTYFFRVLSIRYGHDLYVSKGITHGKSIYTIKDSHLLLDKYDLVLFPNSTDVLNGYVEFAKKYNDVIYHVNQKGSDLEERITGKRFVEKAGLNIPRWKMFKREEISNGIDFIKSLDGKCVIKISPLLGSGLTRIFRDVNSAVRYYSSIIHRVDYATIEEFIDGIEVAQSIFFSNNCIIPFAFTFEHKPLYPGDNGIITGEMGTVVWFDHTKRFINDMFIPLVSQLSEIDYRGFLDINSIYNPADDKIYFVEFTPRFGSPMFEILLPLLQGDFIQFLYSIAIGKPDASIVDIDYDKIAVGNIVCIQYDIPYRKFFMFDYNSILKVNYDFIHNNTDYYYHICKDFKGNNSLVNNTSYFLTAVSKGASLSKARELANELSDKVKLTNAIYRNDIGVAVSKRIKPLVDNGIMSEYIYERMIK